MKKTLLFLGLAAATLSLTNCNKQEVEYAGDAGQFSIRLVSPETKTVNDGLSTKWTTADTLSVFYTKAGTTEYSDNLKFGISDADAGIAKADVSLASGSYDWYILYPYTGQIVDPTTPVGDDGKRHGFLYFGCGSKQSQTQNGLDNMDHIAGIDLPMVGLAKNVSATETPEVSMKHLTSLVKINVTNVYENPVTITGISFTAPEDIIGTYYVDFSGNEAVLEPSGDTYVSPTAKLTVKDAAALASGKTAAFYIAIKPFSAASGSILTVKVDTEEGSSEIETALTKAHDFSAGKIKTLNVDFELETPVETMTVSEAIAADDATMVSIEGAIVAARSTKGFIITDGKSNVYVYVGSAPEVAVGDKVTVKGTKTTYYGLPEITEITSVEKTSSGNTVPRTSLVELTKDNIDSYSSSTADYISVTGKLEKNGSYYNVRLDGADRYASTDYLDPAIDPSDLVDKTVKMIGYFNTIHSKNNYVKVVVTEFVEVDGGGQGGDEGNTLTMTMSEYVDANKCTVSAGTDVTIYKVLQLNESVRMSTTGDANCGSFWVTSSSNDAKQWRLYENKNGNVIISVANGCELKSVKLTFSPSNNGVLLDSQNEEVKSGTAYSVSGSSVTYTVSSTGSDGKGQIRITAVEVVYTGNGTTFPDGPDDPPAEVTTKISIPYNASVYVGETYALNATSNVDATITYESENAAIASVNSSGVITGVAEGTVKVYARITGVAGQYTSDEKYCTVTVSEKPQEGDGTVVFDQAFLAANQNGSKDVISYTNNSTYSGDVTELRIYKGKDFVVSASGGKKITSIKMTCTASGTAKYGPGSWGEGAPTGYTFQADGTVGTWTGSETSVSFNATSNQVRIIELVVTYE